LVVNNRNIIFNYDNDNSNNNSNNSSNNNNNNNNNNNYRQDSFRTKTCIYGRGIKILAQKKTLSSLASVR